MSVGIESGGFDCIKAVAERYSRRTSVMDIGTHPLHEDIPVD